MGILHQVGKEAMRQHFIQELLSRGIKENKDGKSIYVMDKDELKEELVHAWFREAEVEHPDNKWF